MSILEATGTFCLTSSANLTELGKSTDDRLRETGSSVSQRT